MQTSILRSLPRVAAMQFRSGSSLHARRVSAAPIIQRRFRAQVSGGEESESSNVPVSRPRGQGMMARRGGFGGSPLFADMEREIDSLFKAFGMPAMSRFGGSQMPSELSLAVDVKDEGNRYVIHADVPGMKREEVKISLSPDHKVLTISGERKHEERTEGEGGVIRLERSMGSFSRSFGIPDHVDAHNIKAKMQNGVLEMSLPKTEKDEPETKTINIEVEEE